MRSTCSIRLRLRASTCESVFKIRSRYPVSGPIPKRPNSSGSLHIGLFHQLANALVNLEFVTETLKKLAANQNCFDLTASGIFTTTMAPKKTVKVNLISPEFDILRSNLIKQLQDVLVIKTRPFNTEEERHKRYSYGGRPTICPLHEDVHRFDDPRARLSIVTLDVDSANSLVRDLTEMEKDPGFWGRFIAEGFSLVHVQTSKMQRGRSHYKELYIPFLGKDIA